MNFRSGALAAAALFLLAGCAPVSAVTAPIAGSSEAVSTPFDYQLGGGYDIDAGLIVRDRTDTPSSGIPTICYVNGFQTQPGDEDFWMTQHPDLLLQDASGTPVVDENWPDEMLLDTSTADNRAALVGVVGEWIDGCAADGFTGVEFDNLDSYSRSGGLLSESNNFDYATMLVTRTHDNGLEAAQKNSAEFAELGKTVIGFDFAITEECHRWAECDAYTEVYGDRVYNIEYFDDLRGTVDEICASHDRAPNTIFRDRNLTTPNSPDYRLETC